MVVRICEKCNTQFKAKPNQVLKGWARFCSKACSASNNAKLKHLKHSQVGENNPAWKGGVWHTKDNLRISSKKYKVNNPYKIIAHRMVANAVKTGKLIRMCCQLCSNKKSEAHHCDYNKPLDVMWLCRLHHIEWHKNNKAIIGAPCHRP